MPGTVKKSRGVYTESQIERCSKMSGPFGKTIDRLVTESGFAATEAEATRRPKRENYRRDIAVVAEHFIGDKLFDYVPGRSHKAFDSTHCFTMKSAFKLGQHLQKLSQNRDYWINVRQQTADRQAERQTDILADRLA